MRDTDPLGADLTVGRAAPDTETWFEAIARLYNRFPELAAMAPGQLLQLNAAGDALIPVDTSAFAEGAQLVLVKQADGTVVPAEAAAGSGAYEGALVRQSAAQSIPNNSSTNLSWASAVYDDNAFWSAGAPTRLTVPAGVTRVRLRVSIRYAVNTTGSRGVWVRKNATDIIGGPLMAVPANDVFSGNTGLSTSSAVLEVVAGDYFEARTLQNSGAALNTDPGPYSWFSIEVAE